MSSILGYFNIYIQYLVRNLLIINGIHIIKNKQITKTKMKLTQHDLNFINEHNNKLESTKLECKKLQKIYNSFMTKETYDTNCMCTNTDRREFKTKFYSFWSLIEKDITNIEI